MTPTNQAGAAVCEVPSPTNQAMMPGMVSHSGHAARLPKSELLRWAYVYAFRSKRSVESLGLKHFPQAFFYRDIARLLLIDGEPPRGELADEIERMKTGESSVVMIPDISITRPANWLSCSSGRGDYLLRGLGSLQLFNVFTSTEEDPDWVAVDGSRQMRLVGVMRQGGGIGPTNEDAATASAAHVLGYSALGASVPPAYETLTYLAGWNHKGQRMVFHAAAPRFVAVIDGPDVPGLEVRAGGVCLNDFRFIDAAPLCDIARAARAMPDWVATVAGMRSARDASGPTNQGD